MFKMVPCQRHAGIRACWLLSPPLGGFCLLVRQHAGILTLFQTKVNKKMAKKGLFLVVLFPIEIRTLSRIIALKSADFLVLTGIVGLRIGGVVLLYGWRGTGEE